MRESISDIPTMLADGRSERKDDGIEKQENSRGNQQAALALVNHFQTSRPALFLRGDRSCISRAGIANLPNPTFFPVHQPTRSAFRSTSMGKCWSSSGTESAC